MSKMHRFIKSLLFTFVSLLMLAAVSTAQARPFAYITDISSSNVSVNPAGTHGILCLEGASVLVSVDIRHLPRDHRDSKTSALA